MSDRSQAGFGDMLDLPYRRHSPQALLDHFHTRTGVEYFPIIDPEEARRERIDAVLDNVFILNGEPHRLDDPIDWFKNPSDDIEWHILLHKFYYAPGLGLRFHKSHDPRYLRKWMALTDAWICAGVPCGFIAPDVTGRRIQNWIYAHHYFVTRHRPPELCKAFYGRFLMSLHEQVQYLCTHLHTARNHRTLELYAIFLAGVVFPELADAGKWRSFALNAIAENVRTDLLDDGVQCELSTDYHHIVLRNWLCVRRLAALNGIAVPQAMDAGIIRALEFSMHAHKPDGQVPAFSDGDVWSYRDLLQQGYELYGREDMLYVATAGARGSRPRTRAQAFPASGYYVMRSGWGERRSYHDELYMMIDCGPLGAGNHGHFDCLSFELAALGRSLVVDPGRYTYNETGDRNWRAHFRGTASHNTVLVDGRNQTRYEPGPHKMKVRGQGPDVSIFDWQAGEHFAHLHARARSAEYEVTHDRVVHFVPQQYWILSDYLSGTREHTYELLFHLAPHASGQVRTRQDEAALRVETPGLLIAQPPVADVLLSYGSDYVSHRYGEKHAAPVVRFRQSATRASFHTILLPHSGEPPALSIREVPVWNHSSDAISPMDAQAFTVRIGTGITAVLDHWFIATAPLRSTVHFGAYRCSGQFAWVRENAFGELLDMHVGPDATLEEGTRTTPVDRPGTHCS